MSAEREAGPRERELGQLDLDAIGEPLTLLLGALRWLIDAVDVDSAEARA